MGKNEQLSFPRANRKTVFSAGRVEGLIDYKLNTGEFVYNGGFQRSYWERLKDRGAVRLKPGVRKSEQSGDANMSKQR